MKMDEIIKVVKLVEYIGPKKWVLETIGRSFTKTDYSGNLGKNKSITERFCIDLGEVPAKEEKS
jgi:hypothetical protein